MGGFCSSRNYRIPGIDEEEEEGYDDLLTPRGMLRIQRWLALLQQQCHPPVGYMEDQKEEKPPEDTKVEETANESGSNDPRLDPLTSTNLDYHQRLLRQQDKASGGAPLDGGFKIVATAVKPALTPMSPVNANSAKFPNKETSDKDGQNSMVPSVGTELVPTGSTVSRHLSEDSGALQMVKSPTSGMPHVNTGTRIAVKRGNYVSEEGGGGNAETSKDNTPHAKASEAPAKDSKEAKDAKEKPANISRDEMDDIDEVAS